MELDGLIKKELERLDENGLRRSPVPLEGTPGPRVRIDGREVLLFCSNDYLGLANNEEVREAAVRATERYGTGAGASRLVSGDLPPHRELEERIRAFKGTEAALLFNSGYNANLSVITALADRSTDLFSDRLNHASIVDGCILSRARMTRYPHADTRRLEGLLKKSTAKRKIIITEGVYSMDGDVAPLGEIIGLAERYGAAVILDDAHGVGVMGERGTGTLEALGLKGADLPVIEIGTFGKAFGSFGAYATGGRGLKELLVSRARPFIYTTALPPAVPAATIRAIDIAEKATGLRERIHANAARLREGLRDAGLDTLNSTTQIIPVVAGPADAAMRISRRLLDQGVFIQGIRPPTVPEGSSRLRITVSAAHEESDVRYALDAIKGAFREEGAGLS